jgi:hypothetical protein
MSLNLRVKRAENVVFYISFCLGLVAGMGIVVESQGIFIGLIVGILMGILLGFVNSKMAGAILKPILKTIDKAPPLPLSSDEILLRKDVANRKLYFPDGGWLYLTNKRLYFCTNWTNIKKKEITILLKDIIDVELFSRGFLTGGIIGLFKAIGIKIKKNNGKNEIFAIVNEEEWRNSILDTISKNKSEVS